MRLERDALLDLDASLRRRWLLADGLGGWASSTVVGCPAARWDGLFVAADPVTDRARLLLSRFEETLLRGVAAFPLSIARYPGTFHPGGQQYLWSFETEPSPRWTYRIGQAEATREVLRGRSPGTTTVRWKVRGFEGRVVLRLRPFLPFRDADSLTFENAVFDARATTVGDGVSFRPYAALPALRMTAAGAPWSFVPDPRWHRRVELPDELRIGEAGHEDHGSPGEFVVPMGEGAEFSLTLSVDATGTASPVRARKADRRPTPAGTGLRATLERAADAFLVRRDDRVAVVAGYPWFREWGRDSFISLPGLLLARGRVEECGEALASVRPFLREGRFPNRFFGTPAASDYKAIDAALWYALAVDRYEAAGGSRKRLRDDLLPALETIADAHLAAAGDEVLLRAGAPGIAATWMDAVFDAKAVTPRDGFAVEVNALWYSLLDHLARSARDGRKARARRSAADRVASAFLEKLWLADAGRLADQAFPGEAPPDRSIRPNMVLAAALPRSPLSKAQRASVVACARADLLTPRGLRTLSPRDAAYRGRYEGNLASRDAAYHQGTVWPWLLGAYVEASILANGARGKGALRDLVRGFEAALGERCLGQVAEVYDGDPPHRPGGTWAQAWSVAELLRACDLLGIR